MRLLMTTQVIDYDHPVLGFSHTWVREIARRVEHLHVIASCVGSHALPENVTLWSLGKEHGASRLARLLRNQRALLRLVLGRQVDGIFVQQTEIHVLLSAPYALLSRVPVVLFKAHSKCLRLQLRLANLLLDRAVTSTEAGYPIPTAKKLIVGQGVDTEFFKPSSGYRERGPFRVISVGRLSPIKRYEVMIEAAKILVKDRRRRNLTFHVYGGWHYPNYGDYLQRLQEQVRANDLANVFRFEGSVAYRQMPSVYQSADLVVHTCDTESLDKAVLEAMACGLPVVTSIQSYQPVLGGLAEQMIFQPGDAHGLASRIEGLLAQPIQARQAIGRHLRRIVEEQHSVGRFAEKVLGVFRDLAARG